MRSTAAILVIIIIIIFIPSVDIFLGDLRRRKMEENANKLYDTQSAQSNVE